MLLKFGGYIQYFEPDICSVCLKDNMQIGSWAVGELDRSLIEISGKSCLRLVELD